MIFQVGIQVYPPPGPQGVWWQIVGPNKQNVARSDITKFIGVFDRNFNTQKNTGKNEKTQKRIQAIHWRKTTNTAPTTLSGIQPTSQSTFINEQLYSTCD
jgi:hypothetical protein